MCESDAAREEHGKGQQHNRVDTKGCHRHWILRCGFGARCRRGRRRKFAVGPDCAVFEVLLFPDRHGALESVDGETASVECGGAVRGADGDEDAGFADFETSKTVDDGDAVDAIFFMKLGTDLTHFGEGHGFVSFVVEIKSKAIVGLIANESVEGDDGAVFWRANVADESGHVDGLAK